MRQLLAGSAARSAVVGAVLAALVAAWAAAQGTAPVEPDLQSWRSDLEKAEQLLVKGGERRAERARELCDQVYLSMLEWPGRGETAASLLGETLFLLAVAETRIGEAERARWHWAVAQNVWPQVGRGRLDPFPDVAGVLGSHSVRPGDEAPEGTGEGYAPPEPIGMVPIAYPGQVRRQGIEGTTEVVLVVNEAGVPTVPLLRSSCGVPGFDVAVMEAARQWTFSPATHDGRPVEGSYALRATFELGS